MEASADKAPEGTRPNIFRRRYWVDRSIQLPIVGYFMALISLSFLVFGVLFFGSYASYMETVKTELSPELYATMAMQLQDSKDLAFSIFTSCLAFTLVSAFIGGVFLSHRVAGPIYRLRLTLRQIARDKRPHTVRFRKYDYTHAMADDFNEAMKALENR